MGKRYLIEESTLIDLVGAYLELGALEADGVDNWEWYGESFREAIEENGGGENDGFRDVAKLVISNNHSFEEFRVGNYMPTG